MKDYLDSASSANATRMFLLKVHFVSLQQVDKDSALHISTELVKSATYIYKILQIYENKTVFKYEVIGF
jgi:hypothetical protein